MANPEGDFYYVGVDLAKTMDYTAIVILKRTTVYNVPTHRYVATYGITDIERFQEVPYRKVVDRIESICRNPRIQIAGKLVVDETGVGVAVTEMIRERKLYPIGINITGGFQVTLRDGGYNVPKIEIVTRLVTVAESFSIKVNDTLPFATILKEELQNFAVKQDKRTGHETFEPWREGEHDDIVLALAIALWFSEVKDPVRQTIGARQEYAEDYDPLGI